MSPLNLPLEVLYTPPACQRLTLAGRLKSLKGDDLTIEILLELVNKTDWLLRQLVESLEKNISREEVLSPFDKWRDPPATSEQGSALRWRAGRKMQNEYEENKKLDRDTLKEGGLVYTGQGVMKKEEAEKRGLEIIDI